MMRQETKKITKKRESIVSKNTNEGNVQEISNFVYHKNENGDKNHQLMLFNTNYAYRLRTHSIFNKSK